MKNILFFGTLFMIFGCKPKELPTVFELTEAGGMIQISHQTTKDELEKMTFMLQQMNNIECSFEGSTFFEDGKLQDLRVAIMFPQPSGQVLAGSARLSHIQYKYYTIEFTKESDGNYTNIFVGQRDLPH